MGKLADQKRSVNELSQRSYRENIYFWCVICVGALLFGFSLLWTPDFWRINWLDLLIFLVLNIIAEQTFVVLPQGSKISASFAIILSVLLLFNAPVAAFVAIMGALISVGILQQRGPRIAFFNASQYAITYVLAGFCMRLVHHYVAPFFAHNSLFLNLLEAGAATSAYLILNLPLVNGYLAIKRNPQISLKEFARYLLVIKEDRVEIFQTLFFFPIATLVAYSYQQEHNPIIPVVLAFLVFGGLRFIDQRRRIERQGEKMEMLYQLTKKLGESVLQDVNVQVSDSHVFNYLFDSESTLINKLITNQRTSVYRVEHLGEAQRIVHEKSDSLLEPEKVYHMDEPGILQEIVEVGRGGRLDNLSNLGKSYITWRIAYQSIMAQPVKVEDQTRFILVMFRTAGVPFQERDERLLKLLVNAFEITLKNLQLRNQIQSQAIKDGLMGIFNHRYMKLKLDEEMARAKRYDSPLTMIITDVDYFKKFNDTHGHLLGDKVLKEIAEILQDSVRETDIVARYGGEELAILLPETPLQAACEVAERIRKNVASHPFTGKDQQSVSLSLSIGVSCLLNEPHLEPSELIIRTDTALYRAKHQGRNQICKAVVEDGKLIIETYSRGQAPKPADEAAAETGLLRSDLLKAWDESIDKNASLLLGSLQADIDAAGLGSALTRFFEKRLLPAILELLHGLVRTELDAQGRLHEDEPLTQMINRLQQSLSRRLQHKAQLQLLQQLLSRMYQQFIVQVLDLPGADTERKKLFEHGFKVIMQVEKRLLGASLEVVQEQIAYSRSHHQFARQLLEVLKQEQQPRSALIEVLRQIQHTVPQLEAVFLAQPQSTPQALDIEVWLPQDTPLSLQLVLQDKLELTPKDTPFVLELEMDEVSDYLQVKGDLPGHLPTGLQVVLIPLWLNRDLLGLVGLLLPQGRPLNQMQRHWLSTAAQEFAESLHLLGTLQGIPYRTVSTLRALVEVAQGAQGSFDAERMASLAVRLAQRLEMSPAEQRRLRDAAYLCQLGALLSAEQEASPAARRRASQMINQRLLSALGLNQLEQIICPILERWDGSGYPNGLRGQQIPFGARILGLVQAFVQANDGSDPEGVLEEVSQSGYYDPKLCSLLKEVIRESNR